MPGLNAFYANISRKHSANEISYFPLTPSSSTHPGVFKTATVNLVKTAQAVDMEHTIITCDQTIYEIAYALRQEYHGEFTRVILQLRGFHLCHNFIYNLKHIFNSKPQGLFTMRLMKGVDCIQ